MTFDKSNLPAPPEFPASNASYNSIVGKMHKAALCASTAKAAVTAVHSITDHVKGVNTYAKKTRRYGEQLVAAIEGKPVEYALNEGTNSKGEPAAAEKPAMPQLAEPAKAKSEVDPKVAEICAGVGKTFANKSNAKRSLKAAGCDHLPVEWEPAADGYVRPVLIVADDKGLTYAVERGFAAKVSA